MPCSKHVCPGITNPGHGSSTQAHVCPFCTCMTPGCTKLSCTSSSKCPTLLLPKEPTNVSHQRTELASLTTAHKKGEALHIRSSTHRHDKCDVYCETILSELSCKYMIPACTPACRPALFNHLNTMPVLPSVSQCLDYSSFGLQASAKSQSGRLGFWAA